MKFADFYPYFNDAKLAFYVLLLYTKMLKALDLRSIPY